MLLRPAATEVVAFDNLCAFGQRAQLCVPSTERGIARLWRVEDVREIDQVVEAAAGCDAIVHLAAQVAVTTSVADPITDFDVNARGTLNCARGRSPFGSDAGRPLR